MYDVSIFHLIRLVTSKHLTQKWYADDGKALKFEHHQSLFSSWKKDGLRFGYELINCHPVVTPGLKEKAAFFFNQNEVDFIDSLRVLGSFTSMSGSQNSFLLEKATKHVSLLKQISKNGPTNTNSVPSFAQPLTVVGRCCKKPKKVLAEEVIPKMVNETLIDKMHIDSFSLPLREGGPNLLLLSDYCSHYSRYIGVCAPFSERSVFNAERLQNNVIRKVKKTARFARKKRENHRTVS